MQTPKIQFVSFGMKNPFNSEGKIKNTNEQQISFKYKDKMKTLFKEGKLPTVKVDVCGNPLTIKNVTLDHIIPRSKGGPSITSNYMLATKQFNELRGSRPLRYFFTKEGLETYCKQFIDVIVEEFDGNKYIKSILETLDLAKKKGV